MKSYISEDEANRLVAAGRADRIVGGKVITLPTTITTNNTDEGAFRDATNKEMDYWSWNYQRDYVNVKLKGGPHDGGTIAAVGQLPYGYMITLDRNWSDQTGRPLKKPATDVYTMEGDGRTATYRGTFR